MPMKLFHEFMIQAVCNIEAETIDAEFSDPLIHPFHQPPADGFILQVQLDEFLMAFPVSICESVLCPGIIEIHIEPVFVRTVPFLRNDILEERKASSDMIEYAIQHDCYSLIMQGIADFCKVFICS